MGASNALASAASSKQDFVPANMAELAEHYYGLIAGMVRKAGIPEQDLDDGVQYILERFTVTDVIGQYKPGFTIEHQGKTVGSKFSTFLGAKVLLYSRGLRGKGQRHDSHETPVTFDAEAGDGSLSALLGSVTDDYSGVEATELVGRLRTHLAAVPPRSARDTCDLVALFDEIVAETAQAGGFTYAGIQQRFNISGTTAGAWLSRLRSVLSPALGRPAAVIGGVELQADEIAAAVKILRDAPGIMVRQPLEKAGHPLAAAERGWYHAVAKDEIRRFPALATEPGTHRKPAGHVKTAVLHYLERLLTGAGVSVPAPAPEPDKTATAEDHFEAALWRHVSDAREMDRLKALARQAYAGAAAS